MIYFFGVLGGLFYGYDMGVIFGVLFFINNDIFLMILIEGLVVSMLFFGVIFGFVLSGICFDCWGRRKVVFVFFIIFIVGVFVCVFF